MTGVYASKGNSQQPDCTGFSPVSLLNAVHGVPIAAAKLRKIYGLNMALNISCLFFRPTVSAITKTQSIVLLSDLIFGYLQINNRSRNIIEWFGAKQ